MNWFQLLEQAANGGALLVHLTLKATVLLLLSFAVVAAMRRSSASLRHTLWAVCCLCLLLLPVFTIGLPAWQPGVAKPLDSTLQSAPTKINFARQTTSLLLRTTATNYSSPEPVISTGQWVLAILFACWLLGMAVVTRKLLVGFVVAKRLSRRGIPVSEGELWDEFTQCAESLNRGGSAPTKLPRLLLVEDEALQIPLTWGYRRPVVLMPGNSLHWSASCRRAALLHELSHIRRFDWLIQSLASLTCLLYWFHPLTWFASHRLRLESERATDDHVLTTGIKATDYSSSLLEIVRFVGSHHKSASSKDSLMKFAVPMSGTSKIEIRLRSILDPKQSRSAVTKKLLAGITLASFAAIVPLAAAKEPAESDKPTLPQGNTNPPNEISIPIFNRTVGVEVVNPKQNPIVTGFKFNGNKAFNAEELQKVLVSKTGVALDPDNIAFDELALYKLYRDKNIPLRVDITVQDKSGLVTYNLLENPQKGEATTAAVPPQMVMSGSFLHRRGYANYIGTGQPPTSPTYVREAYVSAQLGDQPSLSRIGHGNPAKFAAIKGFKFNGNSALNDNELRNLLVSKIGDQLEDRNVQEETLAIRKAYADKGLKVEVPRVALDEGGTVTYNLIERRPITGFKFSGNKSISDDELKKALTSKIGQPASMQNIVMDRQAIEKAYADKGLSLENIGEQQDADGVVSYTLKEYLVVTGFKFSGNKSLSSAELQKVLISKVGVPLNRSNVASDVTALQKLYTTNSFAVLVQEASQDDAGVLNYTLLEAKLTQIKLSGLNKNNEESVRKLIATPLNESFSSAKLRTDMSHLMATKLFEDVTFRIDDDPAAKGGVVATFVFKEK